MARPSRPRLIDVARALDVSITTVSNAFNRPDQLSDGLRTLVLQRAEAMGYRGPGVEGRLLRTGHAGAIAFYYDEPMSYLVNDPTAVDVVAGLFGVCQTAQAGLLVLPTVPHDRHERPRLPAAIDVAAVDGFILYSLADDDPVIDRAVDRGRPVVCIDMDPADQASGAAADGITWINIDDRGGGRAAAAHVLQSGRRRPAAITLPLDRVRAVGFVDDDALRTARMRPTRQRWLGYRDALDAAGLGTGTLPAYATAVNAEQDGFAAATTLLGANPAMDAILAMSDVLALGAVAACRAQGRRVPQDIAVIGFDDAGARAAAAGLTTVRQNARAKGRAAAEALLGRIQPAGAEWPVTLVRRRTA